MSSLGRDLFGQDTGSEAPYSAVLVYLGLPAVVYLLGFVQWIWALPLLAGLAAVGVLTLRLRRSWPSASALYAVGLALAMLALIGWPAGPYAWDWIKHWALLNTLADERWPVTLALQGHPLHLRFYVGAYLVPAGLTKATGLPIVVTAALWFGTGFALLFRLLQQAAPPGYGWRAAALMPLLLALAGADAWASMALRAYAGLTPTGLAGLHSEWWAQMLPEYPLQFSSPLALLVWVPHQSLATLMVAALVWFHRGPQALARGILATGLLALWSPYGLIGVLPFVALRLWQRLRTQGGWQQWPAHLRSSAAAAALVGGAFAACVAAALSHDLPPSLMCLECALLRVTEPQRFALFWAVELLVPLLLLRRRLWTDPTLRLATLMLLFLPLIAGPTPDPVMRISMAPLFLLMLASARAVAEVRTAPAAMAALLALAACLPTTVGEVRYHLEHGRAHAELPEGDPLGAAWYVTFARSHQVTMREFFETCGWRWLPQYLTATPPPTMRTP